MPRETSDSEDLGLDIDVTKEERTNFARKKNKSALLFFSIVFGATFSAGLFLFAGVKIYEHYEAKKSIGIINQMAVEVGKEMAKALALKPDAPNTELEQVKSEAQAAPGKMLAPTRSVTGAREEIYRDHDGVWRNRPINQEPSSFIADMGKSMAAGGLNLVPEIAALQGLQEHLQAQIAPGEMRTSAQAVNPEREEIYRDQDGVWRNRPANQEISSFIADMGKSMAPGGLINLVPESAAFQGLQDRFQRPAEDAGMNHGRREDERRTRELTSQINERRFNPEEHERFDPTKDVVNAPCDIFNAPPEGC